ncbi:protein Niban 1-like isoform X1 [Anguilla anguilla]|uniref:protein Niban 1-like isoform X1 n=1 Tax=Anguilla anguilla TaxID=7936 RepID=UPI0015AE5803|nr:protein Niban 1-like isoform X1 [Anguilla anguilla]
MGGLQTSHLGPAQRKNLAGHTAAVLKEFSSHFGRQLGTAILERAQEEAGLRETAGTPAVLLQQDPVAGGEVMLEGTLLQYLDGKWRKRHLQVTRSFTVESRDSKEVFGGGWECHTDFILTGCQICTTVQQHRHLVEDACRHISVRPRGKMPFWDCPTEFPIFIQHQYSAPLCLCVESREAQRLWARLLQRAVQHQSTVLQRKNSFESRVFLEAEFSFRQERGTYEPGVLGMGSEEEVLCSLVMEEILPYLQHQIFPRLILRKGTLTWIKLLAEVHSQVCDQVKAELKDMMNELSQQRPLLEKLVRSDLHQLTALQDCIAHRITEGVCAEMSLCLSRTVIPLLDRTVHEVATPVCDGFAAAWQLFLETCDDVTAKGCSGQSLHEILSPLDSLGPGTARASRYLAMLELSAGGRAWLQASWGIHRDFFRLFVYQAQSTLLQLMDRAVAMFRRLPSVQIQFCTDPSQLSSALHRVRDQVLEQLDQDLRSIRAQLVLDCVLQLSVPVLIQKLQWLRPEHYQPRGHPEYAPFLHPNIIHHRVLRASLTREIRAVIRDSLPQDCVSLSPEVHLPSSEPPGGRLQNCTQLPD